jgi:formamidopyrimidine-DNA glycosylase
MPELPEVETMRRGVQRAVGGVIEGVDRPPCRQKPIRIEPAWPTLRRRVCRQRIMAVERAGKRLALVLQSGDRLVFEPRMTGLVSVEQPPDGQYLRLRLRLGHSRVPAVWFWDRRGLGSVRLLTQQAYEQQLGRQRLGPDALELTPRLLAERLARSRREIKVALLDQRAVAGIGNLYASEILHVARIHPQARCDGLSAAHWRRLHAAIVHVLQEAIAYEGSTLADGTYRTALNRNGQYQNHHRVYDRAGQTCPACREESIVRIVQAQRSTFFCPRCQRDGTGRS